MLILLFMVDERKPFFFLNYPDSIVSNNVKKDKEIMCTIGKNSYALSNLF